MPSLSGFLIALAVLHAALGFGAAACVEFGWRHQAAQVVFDAMFFADTGLLGAWAGLGRHSRKMGFIGVSLGLIYLGTLAAVGLRRSPYGRVGAADDDYVVAWIWLLLLALAMVTIAVMMAAALALRQRKIRLVRYGTDSRGIQEGDPLQFSILQLMLLVFVVAVLVKLGPFARAHLDDYQSYVSSLVVVAAGGLCFGGVAFLASWAALATRRPVIGSLAAVALAAPIGLVPPYYFPQFFPLDFAGTAATTALQAVVVAGTLLAVRTCGYRLVCHQIISTSDAG